MFWCLHLLLSLWALSALVLAPTVSPRTMSANVEAAGVHDLAGTVHSVAGPFLHARAVDVLPLVLSRRTHISHGFPVKIERLGSSSTYVKGHPADWLIVVDVRLLHQLQCQLLVVKSDCDNHARLQPGPDHKMMFCHAGRLVSSLASAIARGSETEGPRRRWEGSGMSNIFLVAWLLDPCFGRRRCTDRGAGQHERVR